MEFIKKSYYDMVDGVHTQRTVYIANNSLARMIANKLGYKYKDLRK